MIIGIDGNEANFGKRVGVGEYAFELLRQFSNSKFKIPRPRQAKRDGQNLKFTIYLKDKPSKDLPEERQGWQYRIVAPRKLWTQIGLPLDLLLHNPKPDVFFTPTHYAPRFSRVPTVVSVMDLSFVHFPHMFKASDLYQLKSWTAYSVRKAKKVLTISQASKNDIIKYYHLEPGKVIVTYPGVKKGLMTNDKGLNMDKIKRKYGIQGDYILFVGTLQPRKNVARLIEAFSTLKDMPGDPSLVLVGKKGWLYEEILQAPKKFDIEDKVIFLDYVSDEDLPSLYKNAACFVLPSLYEGFGLPVLEAMSYGCPVVTSNVSSLPEVGGDAVFYINPESVEDIANGIKKVLTDTKLRKMLIEKGYKQAKKFSWEKTARETLKLLEEVANIK